MIRLLLLALLLLALPADAQDRSGQGVQLQGVATSNVEIGTRTLVFLHGGQSNSLGWGIAANLNPPYSEVFPTVKIWRAGGTNDWEPMAPNRGRNETSFGPELSFAHIAAQALPNDDIYIIKYAVGGSVLYENHLPDPDWHPNGGILYGQLETMYANAIANLEAAGKLPILVGWIWAQGAGDSVRAGTIDPAYATDFEGNLQDFATAIRTDFDMTGRLLATAQTSPYWGDPADNATIRAAQEAVADDSANPYMTWFQVDDLPGRERGAFGGHNDTDGTVMFGHRFAQQLIPVGSLLDDGDPPSPSPAFLAGGEPAAVDDNSITMTAADASDATPPIQHFFECVTGACNDSGWQLSPTYTDASLAPGTLHGYTVNWRDALYNKTVASAELQATTTGAPGPPPPQPDTTPPNAVSTSLPEVWFTTAPNATAWNSIQMELVEVEDDHVDTNQETPPVQYYYECSSKNGGPCTDHSGWVDAASKSWTATGLDGDTEYIYRGRGGDSADPINVTDWSAFSAIVTTPSEP